MSDEIPVTPLYEQLDQSTPEYINARIMFLEQQFQANPERLESARRRVSEGKAALRRAVAEATLRVEGRSADLRAAQVDSDPGVESARSECELAEVLFAALRDAVHEGSKELNALQTRSANLRAEINMSGKGRP